MKVLVDAYYNKNFGDDLLVYELIRTFPDVEFHIPEDASYASVLANPKNAVFCGRILPSEDDWIGRGRNKLRSFLGLPKKEISSFFGENDYDVYIQYGGSIFIQTTRNAWKNKVRDYRYIIAHSKKSAVIGCNFGPYFTDEFRFSHRDLFRLFDFVTFRDSASYSLFDELPNTAVAADAGLLANKYVSVQADTDSDYYIVSPIDLSFRKQLRQCDPGYYQGMASLISEIYYQTNKKALLLSFCEGEGDLRACETIRDIVLSNDETVDLDIVCHERVDKTLNLLAQASWIVGCRFHAVMVGISFGKPILPISYSKKIDNELDDLSYSGRVFHVSDTLNWSVHDVVTEFLSSVPSIGAFRNTAVNHFNYFNKLMYQKL